MKPRLRFPEFTDKWQAKKLGSITKVFDGTHQTPTYTEEGVPFYSVEQVTSDNFSDTKFVSNEVYASEKLKLTKGDILMTRIGDIGTPKYISWDAKASFYVSLALIKKSINFNGQFLEKYILTDMFQRELWHRTIHVAFPKKINLGEIGDCRMMLPSKPEQEKIAEFLTAVDSRVSAIDKELELLKKYKKGVMQQIFSQKIRFKDENGKNYPAWQEKKFDEVLKSISTTQYQIQSTEYASIGDYPVVDQGQKNVIGFSDNKAKLFTNIPVIIFGDHTTFLKYINFPFIIGADGTKVLKSKDINDIRYLYFYLGHNKLTSEGYKRHFSSLRLIQFRMPPFQEQQKIADFLTSIDDKIKLEEEKLASAKNFRKSLLQRLFV